MTLVHTDRAVQPPATTPAGTGGAIARVARAMRPLASWRAWLVSTTVFLLFAGVFFGSNAPFAVPRVEAACGQAPPDTRFTSSAADVSGFLQGCGAVGRDAYRALQVADLFYPLVFGLFLATSLALALSHLAPGRRSVLAPAALPLLGTAFDYLENVFAWLALAAFPAPSATGSLLGLASAAKTTTFWVAGALLLTTLGALVVRAVRARLRRRAHGAGTGTGTGTTGGAR